MQHLQYLPYGEPFVNQLGARYMDHDLTTMWLSVDPMADKYPAISPYAYCAWNPVKLVDPDGEDPIYGKILGKVSKIGDDGKSQGKSYYVTGVVKIKVIISNFFGSNYSGSLSPSDNVFHVPTGGVADDVQRTIDMVKASGGSSNCQVEYGAHALYNANHAWIWDPGDEMESYYDENKQLCHKWHLEQFLIDGAPLQIRGTPGEVEFIWHIHPNFSNPSKSDFDTAFDNKYNGGFENATWFTIGLMDNKVTFYNGEGAKSTVELSDFQRMSKQE